MENYPIIPGRGLVTKDTTTMRLQYLDNQGITTKSIANTPLQPEQIKNNIESFIGSVEIPIGLVGPLLFNQDGLQELVYAPAGTLEGALVASMNRGAKVVSMSGGFNAAVLHQKMIRSPMFLFKNLTECIKFKDWVDKHFVAIKKIAEQHSNHAKLQTILPCVAGKSVHLKFVYTTGDAAGQNMTTTCTWYAILWINQHFVSDVNIHPVHFNIEGNGASDKKVSHFSINHGRGIHVIAECELDERVIEKVLRTNSIDFIRCIHESMIISQLDGMIGYNINVANAIAAIFVATGQDLASIHESGTGILNLQKSERGLYCSLHLPNLVIGTVGGGTHLAKQQECLKLMGCDGGGKVQRFAKMIAGFALSLEISTFAAIVGGQFAKAHEKLGRNKPIQWLTKSNIDKKFIQSCLNQTIDNQLLTNATLVENKIIENGIIINLTNRINQKLTGFISVNLEYGDKIEPILLKIKPLDTEVIKGLHLMAANIDPFLADMIFRYKDVLEYKNCHHKEILLYQWLNQHHQTCMPKFYGMKRDDKKELHVLLLESLNYNELALINTENQPQLWSTEQIEKVIETIHQVHELFATHETNFVEIPVFEPWKAIPLYQKLAQILINEYQDTPLSAQTKQLLHFIAELEAEYADIQIQKTIIHNDFNPRNVCIRKSGEVCIYDWELAMIHFPHRDIVEFLSFVLVDNFDNEQFIHYLKYHYNLQKNRIDWNQWKKAYLYSIKEYLVTRVSFYLTGKILMDYEFAERIFLNAFKMIDAFKIANT